MKSHEAKYKDFSRQTCLRTQTERLQMRGFNKSVSKKAVAASKRVEKSIENNSKSGIIIDRMHRKKRTNDYIEPMPKAQLFKIKKSFQKNGGLIIQNKDTDNYLENKNAEGCTFNSTTVLLKTKPSRASVFEELIHAHQYKTGEMDGSLLSLYKCEISAQKILLKNQQAYKLTQKEVAQTQKALEFYQNRLDEILSK